MDVLHLILSLHAFSDIILHLPRLDVLQRVEHLTAALQSSLQN